MVCLGHIKTQTLVNISLRPSGADVFYRFRTMSTFPKELKVCGSASSGGEVCCSADMELRLQARARDSHEKATKETLHKLHQILSSRGNRFHSSSSGSFLLGTCDVRIYEESSSRQSSIYRMRHLKQTN
ncbi:hypothetical protein EAI_06037 [Harpegnathos saltator]|uniref:Uncharacterized protein n=1 Tax=Harpegnathos saltator TaxID=610380 RepID=E2C9G1_HARSA|nr:hypothetical protein EAI_06037 [Harpegnathos saltator]